MYIPVAAVIAEMAVFLDVLYATSEKGEGYLAYWNKTTKKKLKPTLHKVLEQPFAEARMKKIPCVLDTDTPLKVSKYMKCGMELVGEKKLKQGGGLYTMAYHA